MSTEGTASTSARPWSARLRASPRRLAIPLALTLAVGLAFSSPLVGIATVVALLLAGLYAGGQSQIAAVVIYVLALYIVSPRLALGVYEVTPALLVGLGCAMLWASGRTAIGPRRTATSPMTRMIIGFLSVVMLTYALGLTEPLLSAQLAGADRNLVKLFALFGVVLLIVDVVDTPQQLNQVFGLMVAGATFVGIAAVLQSFFDYDIVDQMRLPGFTDRGQKETGQKLRLGLQRATGTARHPIELGTTSAIVLPIALHFVAYARTQRTRTLAMFSSVVLVLAMVLSLSRSAYIGLLVALVMLLPRWTPQRRFQFGIAVVPAVFALTLIAPDAFDAARDLVSNFASDDIEGARVSARTEDYEIVRGLVLERPWFGRGFGTFVGDGSFATDNQYLTSLIETGIIGTIALLALFGTGYGLARRTFKAAEDEIERDLSASVAASLVVGVVSFGVFDAMSFDLTAASMFLMLGMAGALHSVRILRPRARPGVVHRVVSFDRHVAEPATAAVNHD